MTVHDRSISGVNAPMTSKDVVCEVHIHREEINMVFLTQLVLAVMVMVVLGFRKLENWKIGKAFM